MGAPQQRQRPVANKKLYKADIHLERLLLEIVRPHQFGRPHPRERLNRNAKGSQPTRERSCFPEGVQGKRPPVVQTWIIFE